MVCFHSNRLHHLMARNKNAQNICFSYTVTVVHFTDQNWISKTVYCIRCVMVFKIGFTNWNAKSALLRASMVVTYYIKLFRTGADHHDGILISHLLLVTKAKIVTCTPLLPCIFNILFILCIKSNKITKWHK